MRWRARKPELDQAEQAAQASQERAEDDLARAREGSAELNALAERLRELNASNGFAELLVRAVARGSG